VDEVAGYQLAQRDVAPLGRRQAGRLAVVLHLLRTLARQAHSGLATAQALGARVQASQRGLGLVGGHLALGLQQGLGRSLVAADAGQAVLQRVAPNAACGGVGAACA
jgi:hypothetical protein